MPINSNVLEAELTKLKNSNMNTVTNRMRSIYNDASVKGAGISANDNSLSATMARLKKDSQVSIKYAESTDQSLDKIAVLLRTGLDLQKRKYIEDKRYQQWSLHVLSEDLENIAHLLSNQHGPASGGGLGGLLSGFGLFSLGSSLMKWLKGGASTILKNINPFSKEGLVGRGLRGIGKFVLGDAENPTLIGRTLSKLKGLVGLGEGEEGVSFLGKFLKGGGGLLKGLAKGLGPLGGLLKFGAKGLRAAGDALGPLSIPIALGFGAYDAYNGWQDADKIMNKPKDQLTTMDKVNAAGGNAINGFTFGASDWLAKKFGLRNTSDALEKLETAAINIFHWLESTYKEGEEFAKKVKNYYAKEKTSLTTFWKELTSKSISERFFDLTNWVVKKLSDLIPSKEELVAGLNNYLQENELDNIGSRMTDALVGIRDSAVDWIKNQIRKMIPDFVYKHLPSSTQNWLEKTKQAYNAGPTVAQFLGVESFIGPREGAVTKPFVPNKSDIGSYFNPDKLDSSIKDAIDKASSISGVNKDYLYANADIESKFNAGVKNKEGSATGLFQITGGTWNDLVKRYGDKYPILKDRNRTDPEANALGASLLVKDNSVALADENGKLSPTNAYLGQYFGTQGAKKFLNALKTNPNADASQVLPAAAESNEADFEDNGRHLSVQELYDKISAKIERKTSAYATQVGGTPTSATGSVTQPGAPGSLQGVPGVNNMDNDEGTDSEQTNALLQQMIKMMNDQAQASAPVSQKPTTIVVPVQQQNSNDAISSVPLMHPDLGMLLINTHLLG